LVKNSCRDCCAIANGPSDSEVRCELAHTLFGRARMPVRVRKMGPAIPLTAALAILLSAVVTRFIHARNCLTELFLGFYGCCVHRILHGTKDHAAGKGQSAGAFHDANFVHAAAGNIHPSVGGRCHIANRASSGGDRRTGELFRFWIELNNGVWHWARIVGTALVAKSCFTHF
jgi:hypothetical protein